jgi:hypothetical protein
MILKLQVLNEDGSLNNEKTYKSYRELAKDLNVEYHVVRSLQQMTEGKVNRKYLHSTLKDLSKRFKILVDIPKIDLNKLLQK